MDTINRRSFFAASAGAASSFVWMSELAHGNPLPSITVQSNTTETILADAASSPPINVPVVRPPMQLDPGVLFGSPGMKVPEHRFAVAELTQEPEVRIRISRAIPVVAPPDRDVDEDDDDSTYVENVEQTYTVSIPYTERVNGNEVPRVRSETRTRIVPIRRRKPLPGATPPKPLVEQSYTVCVPYTEQIPLEDGSTMTVTRSRQETRTRMVDPDTPRPKLVPQVVSNEYAVDSVKCYDVAGTELSDSEKRARLARPLPILLVSGVEQVDPYFCQLLRADTMIIMDPAG